MKRRSKAKAGKPRIIGHAGYYVVAEDHRDDVPLRWLFDAMDWCDRQNEWLAYQQCVSSQTQKLSP